jgi:excisionase family DNA binding protein
MTEDRVPLFVRLPRAQATALDRLVDETGRRKQQLVSELLADQLAVGRIELVDTTGTGGEEVLTLEGAATLLRAPAETIEAMASAGELPGRRFEHDWRFSRRALLAWLADGERAAGETLDVGDEDR